MVRNGRDTAMGSSEERTPRSRAVVRVLGGFTATVGDDAVNLGGPRQRGVLARILVGGAEAVSAEQLLHDVWGERAAEATVGAVQAYVSRLRRLFGPAALPRHGPTATSSTARWSPSTPTCSSSDVDAGRRALARGNDEDAAALLEAALARWTGPCAFGAGRRRRRCRSSPRSPRDSRSSGWWRPRRWPTRTPARAAPRTTSRCWKTSPPATRCASRWPSSSSARSTPRAGRPTRWPPTTAAAAPWPTSWGSSRRRPCASVRAAVLAHDPLPGVGGTVLPTHLPPRNRSFVGRRGPARGTSTRRWTTTPAARAPSPSPGWAGWARPSSRWSWPTSGTGTAGSPGGSPPKTPPAPPPGSPRWRRRWGSRRSSGARTPARRCGPSSTARRAGCSSTTTRTSPRSSSRSCPRPATATSSSPPATRPGGASPTPSRSGRWPVASRWPTSPPAPATGPSRPTRWPSCSATSRWRSSRRAPTSSRRGCRCPTT